jgi:hypothetical protein
MKFYRNQHPAVLGKYLFNEAPQTECPTIAIFFLSQKLKLKMGRAYIRYSFIILFWFLLLEICFLFFSDKLFYESVLRSFLFRTYADYVQK